MAESSSSHRAGDELDQLLRRAGKFLLRNSSEGTFDLTSTLREIGAAFGATVETLVTMEGLIMLVTHRDGHQRSSAVHAQPSLERLDNLSKFKLLDQRIVAGGLSAADALADLTEIEQSRPPYKWWLRLLGVMLFAAGFSPAMQANWREFAESLVLGAVMAAVYLLGERVGMLRVMLPLLAATVVSLFGFTVLDIAHDHGGPVLVMVPALFVMIPGDFLCAAAAEIAVGQFTVGTIRLVQSFFILFQLAGGVLIGAALSGVGTSALLSAPSLNNLPWAVIVLAWIPFSVGLGLTFCARWRDFGWLTFGVYLAWGVQLLGAWFFGETSGTFLAALALTLVGTLLGRSPKRPPTLLIILGGVFVLTVGSMALRGITTLAGGHLLEGVGDIEAFVEIAGALTFGLIVGTSIAVAVLRRSDQRVRADVAQSR